MISPRMDIKILTQEKKRLFNKSFFTLPKYNVYENSRFLQKAIAHCFQTLSVMLSRTLPLTAVIVHLRGDYTRNLPPVLVGSAAQIQRLLGFEPIPRNVNGGVPLMNSKDRCVSFMPSRSPQLD